MSTIKATDQDTEYPFTFHIEIIMKVASYITTNYPEISHGLYEKCISFIKTIDLKSDDDLKVILGDLVGLQGQTPDCSWYLSSCSLGKLFLGQNFP